MRVLITGHTGFVGWNLKRHFSPDHDLTLLRREVPDAAALERARPDLILHCAAMANPDDCEGREAQARAANVEMPRRLARAAARAGVPLVHYSTDLVYSGARGNYAETDPPDPICLYGALKAESEAAVLEAHPDAWVVRIGAGYGWTDPGHPRRSFLETMRDALAREGRFSAFVDQFRTPTPVFQLGELAQALLERRAPGGIYHWGSADRVSRWQFARAFCAVFGFDPERVAEGRLVEVALPAPRPVDSSMLSDKAAAAAGLAPLSVREGLERLKAGA